jgi:hypothetical protein
MKKIFFTLMLLAGTAAAGFAQESVIQSIDPNAPEIVFESEVVDFGTVEYGADITKQFVFRNTGKSELKLENVHPTCGCTAPTFSKAPIKPGEKGTIDVKYDTKRVGPFEKTITVTSNAGTSTKVIKIKGTVKPNPAPDPNAPSQK